MLELHARAVGGFALPYSRLEFILPRGEMRPVKSRGAEWTDEQGRRHIVATVE
jgi:hypothetical protein